ncbi:UDP-N-acetylglucosamine 2-epimerase (non-hydrolyzing) [Shewanella vesiculosa]|uniref:non-hydrolyzing UDP-N-acetylglucosamine 2-epimerase n=1 Tax=Shewanella vesiculosa TaxID=518738 RepID=UPI000F4EBC44|nr:UDP-N-acetylglucosamine 2-epimerase (non-hydrolyzing) [Shewanella vesiculosa]RPA46604.1 UDP-N-acetylglucosamine 2-epimerase (non-hydrolyzing) [Shewanella vesiculosa]UJL42920.1 UDP-N-acetylglucosamine 2-epimerase (non-hydrolyzing) [Shewanella vesiculosa]
MKIVTIVGARPQFIKAAAVSRAFSKINSIKEIIVHTGQHFDENMSKVFFDEMDIPVPKYALDISSLSHGAMTGRMLEKIEEILLIESPDFVLVYGDTNSTIAGALAASKLHIRIIHIEAGLRSYNMLMPEEVNRIVTDRISTILFCPSEQSVANLKKEGVVENVFVCGDVMHDASIYYQGLNRSKIKNNLNLNDKYILSTIHRAENTDDKVKLAGIITGLNKVNNNYMKVIMPLHPRTKFKLQELGIDIDFEVIDPVGYFDMIHLIENSNQVITDSGGLQKEAYFFKKNCVVIRDQTEWVELTDAGYNVLCSTDENDIYSCVVSEKLEICDNLIYGDSNSSDRIANLLVEKFS